MIVGLHPNQSQSQFKTITMTNSKINTEVSIKATGLLLIIASLAYLIAYITIVN